MTLFSQDALNPGVRKREVFGWAMYDFANSGYTTVVLTAVFSAYFVGGVAGGAPWATFAWTAALAASSVVVMLTMPAIGAYEHFHALRKLILKGIIGEPGIQEPHITLMHPRNANCTDEIYEEIKRIRLPNRLRFNKISLIEQVNGGKWDVLKVFELSGSNKVFPL